MARTRTVKPPVPRPPSLPALPAFIWLFLMQPLRLHWLLQACGITEPDALLWRLWTQAEPDRQLRQEYLALLLGVLLCAAPLLSLLAWCLYAELTQRGLGHVSQLWHWQLGVVYGLGLGLFIACVQGVVNGVAIGIAFSVAGAIFTDLAALTPASVSVQPIRAWVSLIACVGTGCALGLVDGASHSLSTGRGRQVSALLWRVLLLSLSAACLLGWAQTRFFRVPNQPFLLCGLRDSLAFGLCYLAFYWRLPLYGPEALISSLGYFLERHFHWPTLRYSPLFYHELSALPQPYLARHILSNAEQRPELTRQAVEQCQHSAGQRQLGLIALAGLQAGELHSLLAQQRFHDLTALRGRWLPGISGITPTLLAVRDAAHCLQAATHAHFPYHRLQHLRQADGAVTALANQLLTDASPLAWYLTMNLPLWKQVIHDLRTQAQTQLRAEIPNPFHAGEPLTPQRGQAVFKGREVLIQRLQSLLIDPHKSVSIALLGPRRCGKTSLLHMLPALLPDTLCIFFDLQDNPIDSPAAFFQALVSRVQQRAWCDRKLRLPSLPPGPPLAAAARWLEQLDNLAGDRRLLLCFDEFERFESVFREDRQQFLQLMGLFRATIQHRRRLRLLVAGVAPFEELDTVWSDHFINVRELLVGHLRPEVGQALLMRPVPEFPAGVIPRAVADTIVARTGGQPYLLQMYGAYLVQYLNECDGRHATLADVAHIEEQVLEEGTYYFRNLWQTAPADAQQVLLALSAGAVPVAETHAKHWLRRRLLLTRDGQLAIPVFGTWLRLCRE